MSARTREWLGWALLVLATAAIVHLASLWYLPRLVMHRAMAQMGEVNTIHHGLRATAEKHGVVRPSPDLLYSVCPYDVSEHPLLVSVPGVTGTYWSVSLFDDRTNNFYTLNDSVIPYGGGILILPPDLPRLAWLTRLRGDVPVPRIVTSPSAHGLVVIRTLVNDETKLAAIDAGRRKATCKLLAL